VRRREFITLAGSAAAAWPLVAHAQPAERMRRIGVLSSLAADDPEGQARIAAFLREFNNLAGVRDTMSGSNIAGVPAMPTAFAEMRRNWLHSSRMSFSPLAAESWCPCGK